VQSVGKYETKMNIIEVLQWLAWLLSLNYSILFNIYRWLICWCV